MLAVTWLVLIPVALFVVRWWVGIKDPGFAPGQSLSSAIRLGGALTGMGLALSGVGAAQAGGGVSPLVIAADILFAIVAVVLGLQVSDHVFVPGVDNAKAVREGSVGVSVIDAAGAIAVGQLAAGVLQGQGGSLFTAGVFFVGGLVVISVLPTALCMLLLRIPTDAGLRGARRLQEINFTDATASAVLFSGCILAVGTLLAGAVTGDFTTWQESIRMTGTSLGRGMIGLGIGLGMGLLVLRTTRRGLAHRIRVREEVGTAITQAVLLMMTAMLVRVVLI